MDLFEKIALTVLLLAAGTLMLTKPDIVWKMEHYLSVKNGEPAERYLLVTRVTGAVFVLIAIIYAGVFFVSA
ncbi:MAG: nickel ABC transporter permease [Oscillospiraceae bacterium]|nr:nickel ABC transporter permease [Oscillospiraceae bacterium]